jgi:hypothetical protein
MAKKDFFSGKEGLQRIGTILPPLTSKKKIGVGVLPKETKNARNFSAPQPQEFENRQLNLFQSLLFNTDDERDQLSNAIDLWDSVPRYSISRQAMTKARINGCFLQRHETTFQHRGRTYTRIISPARVIDHDGQERDYYPVKFQQRYVMSHRNVSRSPRSGPHPETPDIASYRCRVNNPIPSSGAAFLAASLPP